MKRRIHAPSFTVSSAKQFLNSYSKEQIEYVKDCYTDIIDDMNDQYEYGGATDDLSASINSQEIIDDYLIGAIEDDLLSKSDFMKILEAISVLES